MKAPDKIYVCATHPAPFWFSDKQIPNMIEYIRKDALLKWLKDNAPVEASVYGFMGGYMAAYKQVIDKLNEM